jgi:predicted RNA binding protein YcfA (HicA-like mRNA interferase family)
VRAREVAQVIESKGGYFVRQTGSHARYRIDGETATASTAVPMHPGDIPTGTLAKIERDLAPVLGRKWLT